MVVQGVKALLTDGQVVLIRQLDAADTAAVLRLHDQLPERDRYLRFFTLGVAGLAELAARLTTVDDAHRAALGAFAGEQLMGVAHYEILDDPAEAELALVVSHAVQAHGVGTLLLKHLGSLARDHGVRRLVADVLAENTRMMRVLTHSGLPVSVQREGTVLHVIVQLDPDDHLDDVAEREQRADVRIGEDRRRR